MPRRSQCAEEQSQAVSKAAQTLFDNIRFMSVDNPVRVLAITSSAPNEGKTFVSVNLVSAIAASGASTLLGECDMRRRSVAVRIGVHAQYGIYSVMTSQVPLEQAAVRTPTKSLYFLDAEPHIPNPPSILNSHHFQSLLDNACSRFDYVVFDTPPVTTFVDAAVLGTKVNAVLLIARENFVKRVELQQASTRQTSNVHTGGAASQQSVPAGPLPRRAQPQRMVQAPQQSRAAQPQPAPAQQRPVQQPQAASQPQYQRTHVPGPGDTAAYQCLAEQSRAARGNRSYPRYDDEEY